MTEADVSLMRQAEQAAIEGIWWATSIGAIGSDQESRLVRLATDETLSLGDVDERFDSLFSPDALVEAPEVPAYDLLRAWLRWLAAMRADIRGFERTVA